VGLVLVDIAFTDNPDIVDEILQETPTYNEVGSADEEARWQQGFAIVGGMKRL